MKRWLITLMAVVVLGLSVNVVNAGTLDRGVQINPFFIAGGSRGNSGILQMKYQMAVDSRIGLENRYNVTRYVYTYNTGTFNTFDVTTYGGAGTTTGATITNTSTNTTTYN